MKKNKNGPIDKILRLFKNSDETSGELVVSGTDSISFDVRCKSSKKVKVWFSDEPTTVPCNPGDADAVSFSLIPQRGPTSLLKISWKVSGVRVILWSTDKKDKD